jgi:hypothetical protein
VFVNKNAPALIICVRLASDYRKSLPPRVPGKKEFLTKETSKLMSKTQKFSIFTLFLLNLCVAFLIAPGQNIREKTPSPVKTPEKSKPLTPIDLKNTNLTAEQIAETVILVYGRRENLATIRKTELERGEIKRFGADGVTVKEKSVYERRTVRGESLEKDKIRLDQKLNTTEYTLIWDTNKVFGVINNTVFVPLEEAERAFRASIFHGFDALLRYKENNSTLKLAGKDKQMGVEFYQLDVTDKQNRTTRFNVSAKLFRIQSLEYDFAADANAKPARYVRRFYDYRNAQGTAVPWRSVLTIDGKIAEEVNILTVTYGMKIEDAAFSEKPEESAGN